MVSMWVLVVGLECGGSAYMVTWTLVHLVVVRTARRPVTIEVGLILLEMLPALLRMTSRLGWQVMVD